MGPSTEKTGRSDYLKWDGYYCLPASQGCSEREMRHRNFLEEFHEPCTRNMTLMGSHMYVLLCSSGHEVVQMQLRKSRVCIGFPSICPLHAVHGTLAHPHIGIADADPFEFHSLS